MTPKIRKFINRNRKRNAHLYLDNLVEGYDYVVCPISGERLSMIKDNYIINVLEMDVNLYPGVQRICLIRKENIKKGLGKIDAETGLSKYEVSQFKSRAVLKQVDPVTGKSGYKQKGEKTRATHMSKVDGYGRNGYSQLASKAIVKGNLTKSQKGLILPVELRDAYHRYKTIVIHLTEKHRCKITEGYVTGLAGKEGAHHIDHCYSIMSGYVNKISPIVIGSRENLQMLPWQDNLKKHSSSSITKEELFNRVGYTQEQSSQEFDQINEIIQQDIKNGLPPTGAYILERYYDSTLCT